MLDQFAYLGYVMIKLSVKRMEYYLKTETNEKNTANQYNQNQFYFFVLHDFKIQILQ